MNGPVSVSQVTSRERMVVAIQYHTVVKSISSFCNAYTLLNVTKSREATSIFKKGRRFLPNIEKLVADQFAKSN